MERHGPGPRRHAGPSRALFLAALLALATAGCPPPPSPPGPPGAPGGAPPPGGPPPPASTDGVPPPTGPTNVPAPGGAPGVVPIAADAFAAIDEPTLRAWVGPALASPATAFTPMDEARTAALGAPLAESSGAASLFLNPAVDPYRGAKGGRWTARGGPDLLRCEYRQGDLGLVLTEGANFLALEARPGAPLTPASLRALVARVVRLEVKGDDISPGRAWRVEVPDGVDLTKGAHRFGNPGAPPVLEVATRDDRVDVLVADGRVFFVFYKKIEQILGFADDAWFDAKSRAKLTGR